MIRQTKKTRLGGAVVETAIVLGAFLFILVGIAEFGRYLMALHIAENAAREGARLAVVNTERLDASDIQNMVRDKLFNQISSIDIKVYRADAATGANVGPWNEAGLGECIAVDVQGRYTPLLPTFGIIPASVRVTTKSVMRSEAN